LSPLVEGLGATYDVHLRLIGKHVVGYVVDFLLVLIALFLIATSEYRLKIGIFARTFPPSPTKTQNDRFPSKCALYLNKVCHKVSLCEFCQRQCCKAFINGLSIGAKNGSRGTFPATWKFDRN